ncbi:MULTISPECIES: hypothetical protein [Isoptericola]|nr:MULTISPECIES: hypothetical protein [Isoptericola]
MDLMRDGVRFGACEITAAADTTSIELWNVANGSGERWIETEIAGGWVLSLAPRCKVKKLKQRAPSLLYRLEADASDREAGALLQGLGVVDAHRSDTDFPGSIYLTIDRNHALTGGLTGETGDELVTWFNHWVRQPDLEHNLAKLAAVDRAERHLFVLMPGFTSAPFSVSDLLARAAAPLPDAAPDLPPELTHLWFMSTWNAGGIFHWSPTGWARFDKLV